ncbi:hypothetical protein PMES_02431 [Profundibacterium mesophilum KAUST100406-0324]|uniref:Uncharacterized protein n=1 Tax=Profundibacterium mesophilum KAUST100406-0324 TaxID=1037889 RepID=A0A921NV13_9RHOB|nr:hypothetical protein PMES_02431 [Profundibacterium mesophilum KAUST100406-0324]
MPDLVYGAANAQPVRAGIVARDVHLQRIGGITMAIGVRDEAARLQLGKRDRRIGCVRRQHETQLLASQMLSNEPRVPPSTPRSNRPSFGPARIRP